MRRVKTVLVESARACSSAPARWITRLRRRASVDAGGDTEGGEGLGPVRGEVGGVA